LRADHLVQPRACERIIWLSAACRDEGGVATLDVRYRVASYRDTLMREVVALDGLGSFDGTVGYRGVTACHATGISYRQLDYWARTGLVVPSIRDASGSGTQRLYSFRDLVVLKVVKRLLDAGVSLQNIRKAIDTLRSRGVDDLAGITLISDGTTVYECRSPEEVVDLLQGGQGVFGIAIGGAFKEIQGSLSHLPSERAAEEPAPSEGQGLPAASAPRETVLAEDSPGGDELAARRARRRAG
jgi:DNA-binding transcriptional MerR regulator